MIVWKKEKSSVVNDKKNRPKKNFFFFCDLIVKNKVWQSKFWKYSTNLRELKNLLHTMYKVVSNFDAFIGWVYENLCKINRCGWNLIRIYIYIYIFSCSRWVYVFKFVPLYVEVSGSWRWTEKNRISYHLTFQVLIDDMCVFVFSRN